MVFKRLFNWIKFKTLPPSFLFRNRLFIERDSKSRRVLTNLGLTFRNSKWADYTRTDINLTLKNVFKDVVKYFIFFLAFIIGLSYYSHFYNNTLLYNEILFIFWWFKDFFSYYLFTSFSLITISAGLLMEKVYFYVIGWVFSTNNTKATNQKKTDSLNIQLGDYKYIYYAWLTNPFTHVGTASVIKLFDKNTHSVENISYFQFLYTLYNTSHNLSNLTTTLNTINPLLNTYAYQNLNTNHLTLTLNYFIKAQELRSNPVRSLGFQYTRFAWRLVDWVNFNSTIGESTSNASGLFYLSQLDFNTQNNFWINNDHLFSLTTNLQNQLTSIKVSRFLYNYNYLHRKVLKYSHKLTTAKKLITSGFYNETLTTNNIWASDFLSNNPQAHSLLNTELYKLYGSFFSNTNVSTLVAPIAQFHLTNSPLKNLNFFEESYFFSLKRYFFYNTLAQNRINFSLYPYAPKPVLGVSSVNSFIVKFAHLLKSNTFINSNFVSYTSLDALKVLQNTKITTFPLKDVKLLAQDSSLFFLEDESILANLSSSSTSSCSTLFFYNNLSLKQTANVYLDKDTFKPLNPSSPTQRIVDLQIIPNLQACVLKDLNFWLKYLSN